MIGVALLAFNHILPTMGVFYGATIVWKIARGRKQYPISRWFF